MRKKFYYLSASLICANMLELGNAVRDIEKSGCDMIHYDVMDGVFVPRYGLLPEALESVKTITRLPVSVHMMTIEPEKYLPAFIDAGADCLVVHAEVCTHLHRTLSLIKDRGKKAGVALNITTPLSVLDYVLDNIDTITLMAINPGIVGHKIIPIVYKKIEELNRMLMRYGKQNILIEIDGGVTFESAPLMLESGADILVCGSSTLFKKEGSVEDSMRDLREILKLPR